MPRVVAEKQLQHVTSGDHSRLLVTGIRVQSEPLISPLPRAISAIEHLPIPSGLIGGCGQQRMAHLQALSIATIGTEHLAHTVGITVAIVGIEAAPTIIVASHHIEGHAGIVGEHRASTDRLDRLHVFWEWIDRQHHDLPAIGVAAVDTQRIAGLAIATERVERQTAIGPLTHVIVLSNDDREIPYSRDGSIRCQSRLEGSAASVRRRYSNALCGDRLLGSAVIDVQRHAAAIYQRWSDTILDHDSLEPDFIGFDELRCRIEARYVPTRGRHQWILFVRPRVILILGQMLSL